MKILKNKVQYIFSNHLKNDFNSKIEDARGDIVRVGVSRKQPTMKEDEKIRHKRITRIDAEKLMKNDSLFLSGY